MKAQSKKVFEHNMRLQLKVKFSYEDYLAMLERQGGVCAICHQPETEKRQRCLNVDHDHVTGKVRGLLCSNCNHALGQFDDNPETIRKAIAYLQKHKA